MRNTVEPSVMSAMCTRSQPLLPGSGACRCCGTTKSADNAVQFQPFDARGVDPLQSIRTDRARCPAIHCRTQVRQLLIDVPVGKQNDTHCDDIT